VIAQRSNASEVHKLFINHSMNQQTPVTLSVGTGVYLVSIIAARRGMGILDSTVGYTELQIVINGMDPVGIPVTTTSVTTSKGGFQCRSELLVFIFSCRCFYLCSTQKALKFVN
jgi:hypothetical protein